MSNLSAVQRAGRYTDDLRYNPTQAERAMCAVLDVVRGLKQINDELLNRGVEEPALVKQAIAAADALAGLCVP